MFFLLLCICSFKSESLEEERKEEENKRAHDRDGQLKMREYRVLSFVLSRVGGDTEEKGMQYMLGT